MDYLLSKTSAIELLITGLCLYKFPNFTLVLFGIMGASKLYNNFSKTKSNRIANESMKAALYHPTNKNEYVVKTIAIPKFSKNQLLVKVNSASLNPIDYKISTTLIPFLRWFVPHTIGRDFSGTVLDIGENVKNFRIGDEVYGNAAGGSLQEFTYVNEDQIGHKPRNMSFIEAARLGLAGLTSCKALTYWGNLNGNKVLIIGASGGCGSLGVEIA